jgi:hypothetical protein
MSPLPKRFLSRVAAALVSTALLGLVFAGSASAADEITSYEMGPSTTQAGGHPNIEFEIHFTGRTEFGFEEATHDIRRLLTHLPTGVIGNPHAIPTCTLLDFSLNSCPPASQIGVAGANPLTVRLSAPLYNMETKPGEAGVLAFKLQLGGTQQFIEIRGRTDSDYGLDSVSTPIFHPILGAISEIYVELWGVPASPENDWRRFTIPVSQDCQREGGCAGANAPAGIAPEPFLSNPTACGVPLTASMDAEFYNRNTVTAEAPYPPTTGCDQLAFNPSLTVKPTTDEADSASGLDATLKVPQIANPFTPSPSQIKGVRVALPDGFSINPNAADGKTACLDSQTGIGTLGPATCPEFSKVGTLVIDSSALPGPVPGAIYLGEPEPGDPYRLILAASGFGTNIKLAGSAKADPDTGGIVVAFENLPQSPLTEFDMHFFGSERGLMATPVKCGTYPVHAEFEPWNNVLPDQESTSFFTVGSGPGKSACSGATRSFGPSLVAGTANPTAGRHTPFRLELVRKDGDQNLTGLTVATPEGFSGTLKGIPYCPEAALAKLSSGEGSGVVELAEPTCPAESLVGKAIAGTGAGNHPLYSPGKVYLGGPYKGAPLSLMIVIPAVSGPYDLGNVAVRAAVFVDPVTARVTTVSDPLPQILEGIPLRTRSIRVELDRPNFALNPTNCDPLSTDAIVTGSEGATATPSSHFQVGNCAILPFQPRLSLTLSGGLGRLGHPAIKAVLQAQEGEANLGATSVALPKGELLDNSRFETICTRVQFAADACPEGSKLGVAEAFSPLLDEPLRGGVYLRPGEQLPDLVADLEGQIDIELAGKIDTVHGGSLRTRFLAIPDAPVTKFVLNLAGGAKGLLQNSKSLCGKPKRAQVKMTGQNGAVLKSKPKLKVKCGKKSARHKRHSNKRKAG